MNTKLTGRHRKALRQALTSAFPSPQSLKQFCREELEISLHSIVGNHSLTSTAFEFIDWAESREKIKPLCIALMKEFPKNLEIRNTCDEIISVLPNPPKMSDHSEHSTSQPHVPIQVIYLLFSLFLISTGSLLFLAFILRG